MTEVECRRETVFAAVLVERRICYDEQGCNKNCVYLQAQHPVRGGGYVCELFDERVDDRVRLPACVAAEERAKAP